MGNQHSIQEKEYSLERLKKDYLEEFNLNKNGQKHKQVVKFSDLKMVQYTSDIDNNDLFGTTTPGKRIKIITIKVEEYPFNLKNDHSQSSKDKKNSNVEKSSGKNEAWKKFTEYCQQITNDNVGDNSNQERSSKKLKNKSSSKKKSYKNLKNNLELTKPELKINSNKCTNQCGKDLTKNYGQEKKISSKSSKKRKSQEKSGKVSTKIPGLLKINIQRILNKKSNKK